MNTFHLSDFTIVIRAAGERTIEACKQVTLLEISENNIHVIECKPFEAALRECYKIGINSDKEWMVTIDADVLPKPGFVKEIQNLSQKVNDNVIMFNAIIHDKLMMSYRSGGIKVYRVKYLSEALKMIPRESKTLRPEATTLKRMMEKGFKKKNFNSVVGLHDYEQYYKDVYRTAYFHATKHRDKILDLFKDWKIESETDTDFLVAIKGAMDGILSERETKSDVRYFEDMSEGVIKNLGLKEKSEINPDNVSLIIENALSKAGSYYRLFELNGIKNQFDRRGFVGGLFWYTGLIIEVMGKKIKSLA